MRLFVSLLVAEAFVRNSNANSTPVGSTLSTAASVDSLTAGKNDVPVLRLLRTIVTADEDEEHGKQITAGHEDDEERVLPFDLSSKIDAAGDALKLYWRRLFHNKAVNSAFKKYDLVNAKDDLFMHKNFNNWILEAKKIHPNKYIEAAFATLLKYYDRDVLFKVLEAAKVKAAEADANAPHNDISNVVVAKLLQDEVLKSWSVDKTNPHQVFEYMGLSSNQKDVLTSPLFSVWTNYIKQFNSRNPTLKTNDIKELLRIIGDEDVFLMIQAAKTKDDVATLATDLQEQLMTYWLEKEYSPSRIIKVVEHGRELDDVLTSPYLSVWTNYLEQYNLRHSEYAMNEIKALTRAYNDEDVFRMLETAKTKDGDVGKLAKELQKQNMEMWIDEKYNPYDLLDIIGPSHMDEKSLATRWSEYLPFFKKYVDDLKIEKGGSKINARYMMLEYYTYDWWSDILRLMNNNH